MKYRLIFNGELAEDADLENCLSHLAELFGKDPVVIQRELFRGKPIVVKKTSDEQVAGRFIQAFEQAGAVLRIETAGLDFGAGPPPAGPAEAALPGSADTSATRERQAIKSLESPAIEVLPELAEDAKTRQRAAVPKRDDRKR